MVGYEKHTLARGAESRSARAPLRVALADPDETRREQVRQLLSCLPDLEVIAESTTADVRELLSSTGRPDSCVVALGTAPAASLAVIARLTAADPLLPVLVIGNAADPHLVHEAMKAGVRGFLGWPIDPCELAAALGRAGRLTAGTERQGRIIAVLPSHGGCGASTLAVNLGVGFAVNGSGRAVIVDLVHNYGTVALHLDLRPTYSLADVCHGGDHLDLTMLRSALAKHASGVEVLAQPGNFTLLEPPDADQTRRILVLLRAMFAYTVADLPRSLDESTAEVLRLADEVLLVLTPSLASVANARKTMQALRAIGVEAGRIRCVLNGLTRGEEIGPERVREILECESVLALPADAKRTRQAAEAGRPLVAESPGASLSRSILSMAQSLNGGGAAVRCHRPGWLKRLMGGA